MPLNQVDVFSDNKPEHGINNHVDIFKPASLMPINVNSKLESIEKTKKHMAKELEDNPL